MLWGVAEAEQQPFSCVAMAVQVWQCFDEARQEGAQEADEGIWNESRGGTKAFGRAASQ